nr:hypothetical protein KPHV_85670 [Kitasatospora purpeofusca]
MITSSAQPALAGALADWEACIQQTHQAALAALATAMPGATPGSAPTTLLAPTPGGGRLTLVVEASDAVTLTAERVSVAAVQALLDHGRHPEWFDSLVTPEGEFTDQIAEADPDEYGQPSPSGGREDRLLVRPNGTADLHLHGIGLRAAADALHASRRVFTAPTTTAPVPADAGRA